MYYYGIEISIIYGIEISKYLSSKIFNNTFEIVTIVNNIFKKISSNRLIF